LLLGFGWVQVVGIGVDRGADGSAPAIAAEGFRILVPGELDALHHDLGEVGEGTSGLWFDVALGGGGKDASEGGVEITGGEITAREEIGNVATDVFGGLGLRLFAGMKTAELRMTGLARSEALAAIGESETTQGRAVLWAKRGHGILLKLELKCDDRKWKRENRKWTRGKCPSGDLRASPSRVNRRYRGGPKTDTPRRKRGVILTKNILRECY
jgi:hypothetical protein